MRNALLLTATAVFTLTACGQNQTRVVTWASGSAPTFDTEEVETVTLKPVTELTSETEDDGIVTLMKAAAVPVNFSIDRTLVKLTHDKAYTWQGCDKGARVRGGYASDSKCGRAYFQPKFESQMNKRFYLCIERAAAKANVTRPAYVFLNHDGSYNNRSARNSKRLSMHAYARAIDIASFNLFDGAGKVTKISTNVRNFKGATKTFYNEFRQCWKDAMPATCKPGKTEYKGSIGIPSSALGGNTLHNDHIHLSFAQCAG